jgi:hypothetical protein
MRSNVLDDMKAETVTYHGTISAQSEMVSIPSELYMRQQKERDSLVQGLMMYRYKYEEMEREMRLLPAPVSDVTSKLEQYEKENNDRKNVLIKAQLILKKAYAANEQYKASIEQLKAKLAEEERARDAFRIQWELAQAELKKPWWKKLLKR